MINIFYLSDFAANARCKFYLQVTPFALYDTFTSPFQLQLPPESILSLHILLFNTVLYVGQGVRVVFRHRVHLSPLSLPPS